MIGTTVSHYRITGFVGGGGMGKVYRAQDLTLPREVALKFLAEGLELDASYRERFLREAQAASALDHPNICTIYEIGEAPDGRTFIAMPCYDGRTVHSLLEDGPLPPHEAVTYALGVARGMAKAHSKGILHRDIKPANLFVTRDGVVKVLDFGVAKLYCDSTITSPGAAVGTWAYMSPEQVRGEDLDARSDIFSLGATIYEMVTGRKAFRAENQASTIHRILNEDPEPPHQVRPAVSPELDRVIMKSMSKNREDRFESMSDLARCLEQLLRETDSILTRPLDLPPEEGSAPTLGKRLLMLAGVLAIILVGLNGEWILEKLGLRGVGPPKGVAVMAGEGGSGEGEPGLLEAGMVSDLISQVDGLAERDPDLWVVPNGQVEAMGVASPAAAADHLGVDAVLTAAVQEATEGDPEAGIELRNARTGRRVSGFRIPLEARNWSDRLEGKLVEMLDVDPSRPEAVVAGSRQTDDATARREFLLGLGYLATRPEGYADSARACFDRSLAIDSLFVAAYVRRAQALCAMRTESADTGWAAAALASCETALRIDPDNAGAFDRRGRIREALGRTDEALADYARAVALSPRNASFRRAEAWCYFGAGRYAEAEACFRSAAEAVPGYWGVHADLGYFYHSQGRNEEARVCFERLAEVVPAYPAAYNYLGAVYYALERWDDAIRMFERSFELEKSYFACANLGTLYYFNGRFEDAARMFEWAWEYDNTDYLILGNLASAYYWIPGKREHAIELFRRAAAMAERRREETPDDPELLSNLADYYSVDRGDTARVCAELALALAPDNAEVELTTARVYELLGERAKALVLVGRALEHGYPAKEIEHDPQLEDLRDDPRYELLVSETSSTGKEN